MRIGLQGAELESQLAGGSKEQVADRVSKALAQKAVAESNAAELAARVEELEASPAQVGFTIVAYNVFDTASLPRHVSR